MKKNNFSFLIKGAFFLTAVFLVCPSCSAGGSSGSAKAQTAPQTEMQKAFADAGLRLLNERISPREFSLPLASQGAAGDTHGEMQSLGALNGKVVFLNFWATWCGPCVAEMPSMEALYNRYKEKGFEILAVNCMEGEKEVIAFMKDNGLSFPAALDVEGKVGAAYGIQAIPTTFILDRDGKIIVRLVGSIDWNTEKIHAAIESLLNS